MPKIQLTTIIQAPIERCFDLSRSVDVHVRSAAGTGERAVAGKTSGLMGENDTVTWEARHFFIQQRLSSQITIFHRPSHFRDSQVAGVFRRFDHDHYFEFADNVTMIQDIFDFECRLGVLGRMAAPLVALYLKIFLQARNQIIKEIAESDAWSMYLS